MDKILFIDGHNFMYRGVISFNKAPHFNSNNSCNCGSPWNNEENFCYGEKFNITFNFFRNLRAAIENFAPTKCFFVLEGHPQFRYDLYPEYKANRKIIKTASAQESKDTFFANKDIIVNLLKNLPITVAYHKDYECDDVISTLVNNIANEEIIVLSNDSDFLQLLQKGYQNVNIYSPHKKAFMEMPQYHYVAWKSLRGDKSDNISGLVGDKTAQKLLNDPKKFDDFMNIEENRANFSINKQLIEFKDVPIDEIIIEEGVSDFDFLRLEFEKMKFESIINEKYWQKFVSTFNYFQINE